MSSKTTSPAKTKGKTKPQTEEVIDIMRPGIFDIFDMAKALRCSVFTVRRKCISGEMPHLRMSRQFRFTLDQRVAYLESNKAK